MMAHKLIVVYVPLNTKYAILETFPRKKKKHIHQSKKMWYNANTQKKTKARFSCLL